MLCESVRQRLSEHGFGVLAIASREIKSGDTFNDSLQFSQCNQTQLGLKHLNVAGVIVCAGVIGHTMKQQQLAEFVRGFAHLPVVSLGVEMPGVISVTVDSTRSVVELMRHMTEDPKRKRFVFIRGYAGSLDSLERERVFRQVMAERGLEVDESLMVDGDFVSSVARNRIIDLVEAGHEFDAVIAVNDTMAVSAILALQGKGIKVPQRVIVSGFDDSPEATALYPAVTTVRQRFELQAQNATDLLIQLITDADQRPRKPSEVRSLVMGSDLVKRESSNPALPSDIGLPPVSIESADAPIATSLQHSHEKLARELATVDVPEGLQVDRLVQAFFSTMCTGSSEFAVLIEYFLKKLPAEKQNLGWWRHARQKFLHSAVCLPTKNVVASALAPLAQASTRVGYAIAAAQARSDVDQARYRETHHRMLLGLAGSTSRTTISRVLGSGLHHMGMRRAWMVMQGPTLRAFEPQLKLVMSLVDASVSMHDLPVDEAAILPEYFQHELSRDSLVFQPLISGQGSYGYLLLDPAGLDRLEFESIAASVCQAFRHIDQFDSLQQQALELTQSNVALNQIARYDSLTGLPNRALFHENLEHALAMAERSGERVALLFFDLDGFKTVNDTLGHSAGDELLKSIAGRLQTVLRRADQLARLGGDEFTVIASEVVNGQAADRIAAQIHQTVSIPSSLDNHQVKLSASIGVAYFPADGEDAETLIRNADTAMYNAKTSGKNRHVFYAPEMSTQAIEQMELDAEMRKAFAQQQFYMHYQPRYELSDHRIVAAEALMRWNRDQDSIKSDLVAPERFIPLAEQTGFIAELDAFALEQVCRQAGEWVSLGTPIIVSVNLSVKCLQKTDIVALIEDALERHQLDPQWLEFEITESAAMTDFDNNVAKLKQLRKLGCRIAIDDFGTGYSSLSYLKRLPVSTLKIDQSFLTDIAYAGEESADTAIVRAVIALGRSLEFTLVAEGVERESQLHFLNSVGCDQAQGFYLSKPLPSGDITRLLKLSASVDSFGARRGDQCKPEQAIHEESDLV